MLMNCVEMSKTESLSSDSDSAGNEDNGHGITKAVSKGVVKLIIGVRMP
jgi:hypothetical protein